jgi:peptide/nickel transport system ATP-binding protein
MTGLRVQGLSVHFRVSAGLPLRALEEVSFGLDSGTTLGVIGDSGAGKSTLAHCLVRLLRPVKGRITLDGLDWLGLRGRVLRRNRWRIQLVWQDPRLSLNPYLSVLQHVTEPLTIHGRHSRPDRVELARETLRKVGLREALLDRSPELLSGGQRQRLALARAIVLQPQILIADEPTTALDPANREAVLELLVELGPSSQRSLVLVTHDLDAARLTCREVLVLQKGRVIEAGLTAQVLSNPNHPGTRAIVDSSRRLTRGD